MTNRILMIAIAGLFCLATGLTSPAMARNAKCLITSGSTTQFSGTCDFRA